MSNKVFTLAAQTISVVFHPLVFPTYLFFIFYAFNVFNIGVLPVEQYGKLVFFVFFLSFLSPFLFIILMKYLKIVDSIFLDSHQERLKGLMMSVFFYGFLIFMFKTKMGLLYQVNIVFMSCFICQLICFVATFFHKISLHTAGASASVCILISLFPRHYELFYLILGAIILVGLIASSRLYLQKHTIWEVASGFGVGVLSVFFASLIKL